MNILTFDIEEWFHLLDHPSTKYPHQWEGFESRIHRNMDLIFNILDSQDCKATFFCIGWIAKKYPKIIQDIANRGYEIGSHTTNHKLVYEHTRSSFDADLSESIKLLEDLTGNAVKSFRAPGFSITKDNIWAFDVLVENGIEIDSSVFPTNRSHGGFPEFGTSVPTILEVNGMKLKEFPINTKNVLGQDLIFSGGGYFRLFPYYFIDRFMKSSDYVMTYFHPRDFDSKQPLLEDLSLLRRFKSYYGLASTENKLNKLLGDFVFYDLDEANKRVSWSNAKVINLDELFDDKAKKLVG